MISKTPLANPVFKLMVSHLVEAVTELFAAYDVSVRLSSGSSTLPISTEVSGVAIIGYAGERVRGALIMVATESTTRAWLAAIGVRDGEVADTLGEFSNMLLGRLKGRLLGEGFPILLATPTTASGVGLRLSLPPSQSTSLVFDGPDWSMGTRLDATFESGFVLVEGDRESPAQAGETILF